MASQSDQDDSGSVIAWRGEYRDGLREGWFKKYREQCENDVDEYVHYENGLRNGYSFTISNQSYISCKLDDKACCCKIDEYPSQSRESFGDNKVDKKRILHINHYVNGLLEGYQFILRGDGSIDQIDFYIAGDLIPSKRYKFLGANIYVPLEVCKSE